MNKDFQYFFNTIEVTYEQKCINFSGLITKSLPFFDFFNKYK